MFSENGGRFGDYLERTYSYLMTIKPTSVEPEREFSLAGQFVTKVRSRLSDETLDELTVERRLSEYIGTGDNSDMRLFG
ncbi:hypothetical protein TNCV_1173381 [Trichonephila clavipes]|uniref:HAT C-terminal dimerisation domain-containing protein n=1 Tax=Trichonephila clavipes TaxID=2585209 RepID=A0A8X6VER5_TRICX|nr:hypothetical protein TNCV_1173381 [Trichonephila clavipes]